MEDDSHSPRSEEKQRRRSLYTVAFRLIIAWLLRETKIALVCLKCVCMVCYGMGCDRDDRSARSVTVCVYIYLESRSWEMLMHAPGHGDAVRA